MTAETQEPLRCSFCGKNQRQVERFVNGPSVRICNACVDICNEIIAGAKRAAGGRAGEGARPRTREVVHVGTFRCPECRAEFELHTETTEGHS